MISVHLLGINVQCSLGFKKVFQVLHCFDFILEQFDGSFDVKKNVTHHWMLKHLRFPKFQVPSNCILTSIFTLYFIWEYLNAKTITLFEFGFRYFVRKLSILAGLGTFWHRISETPNRQN